MKKAVVLCLLLALAVVGCEKIVVEEPAEIYRADVVDEVPVEFLPRPMQVVPGAKTWRVQPGADNSAAPIQKAIDQAQAGDTIFLEDGLYLWRKTDVNTPPVQIKKKQNLILRSDGGAYVFCQDEAAMPLEMFTAKNILIERVHFGHSGMIGRTCTASTSWLYDVQDVTLRGCVLHGSGWNALAGWKNERVLVEGCALGRGTKSAVDLSFTNGLTVRNCYLADNGGPRRPACLLAFVAVTNAFLQRNLMDRNRNRCLYKISRCKNVNIRANVFFANAFEVPEFLTHNGQNEVLVEGFDAELSPQDYPKVWPNRQVRAAAKRYRKFLRVLKKHEQTLH